MQFYQVCLMFFIYAFLGWCAEVAFAAVTRGVFVNRGFLNGPVCPVYGFGAVAVILALMPLQDNLFLLFLGSILLTSAIEFVAGFLLEKIFKARWWDYSSQPFNISGYICLRFSLMWGFACVMVIRLVQPLILGMIQWLPQTVGIVLSAVFAGLMLFDLSATVVAVRKLSQRLTLITDLAGEIHTLSDKIGQPISAGAINAKEKAEEARVRLAEQKAVVQEKTDTARERLEEQKTRLQDLREQMKTLLQERKHTHARLVKAFPDLRFYDREEALESLRRRYDQMQKNRKNGKAN